MSSAPASRVAAYALAAVLALGFSYDLFRMPVQVSDSLGEILSAQHSPSAASIFVSSMGNNGYLRPLRLAQIKALFDASQGHYTVAYRSVHVGLFIATMLLFVRALRVETSTDLAAAAFALTVFTGMHTFTGTVRSAYPINHFLEMIVFALVALNLAQSRGSWWADAGAAVTFVAASLTLESGLLVWVVVTTAWLSGMRGVSRRGVIAVTVLLLAYAYLRFVYQSTGMPSLIERSSGFGLSVLQPEELQSRFSGNPLPFYLYNIVSSISSVLFAEPRAGVWDAVRAWRQGEMLPRMIVALVSSTVTTVLIGAAAMTLRRQWDDAGRLLVVFGAVLVANAALSYAYTKDEIVSVAGAFYAIAAYVAVKRLAEVSLSRTRLIAWTVGLAFVVASTGWAIRSAGLHYALVTAAFKQRNDWVFVPPQEFDDAQARALIATLRTDALYRPAISRRLVPGWAERWFDE
jgi:hypothetical protein